MDEKTFKKLLAEQAKAIDTNINKRFIEQNKAMDRSLAEQEKSIDAKMDQKLAEQTKSIDAKLDQRFTEQNKAINQRFTEQTKSIDVKLDQRFAEQNMAIDDKLEAQDVRMMQYVGALGEDYQSKLQAALEVFIPLLQLPEQVNELAGSVYEMRQIVDPTFERVGELSENETITNKTLHNHEKRIRVLEKG